MPPLQPQELLSAATAVLKPVGSGALLQSIIFRDEVTLVVDKGLILPILKALRDDARLAFNHLSDVTAVDYLEQRREPRFDIVYHLYSHEYFHWIRLRAPVGEDADECCIDSACSLWPGANFMERETFDLFGIHFNGHPDLRRIMMPENWIGYPLRKDFPLGGSTSFYYKQDTNEYAGEPDDLIPRIRVQDSDV